MTDQPVAGFRDRRGLLLLFGVGEILIGALCAGMLCVMSVAWVLASRLPPDQAPNLETSNLVASVLLYAGAAAFFVVMGTGTIKAKRWARAIMLVVAWPWLLAMIAAVIFVGLMLPGLLAGLERQPGAAIPGAAVVTILVAVGLCPTILPVALILFYAGRNVRHTFETADPRPCWTDGRPLSVLALALVMFTSAFASLAGVRYRFVALFGWMLTGRPAVVASLALACACVWLGWGLYRMTPAGWWANLWFAVLLHLSWWVTTWRIGSEGVLQAMRLDEAHLSLVRHTGLPAIFFSPWVVALSGAAWVAVLLALKRHFNPAIARPGS